MKRVVDLLKEAGVVDRLQNSFNSVKPPVGTSDEYIIKAIEKCINTELEQNKELLDKFFVAMMKDVSEEIKNEMHIEYSSIGEFKESARSVLCDILELLIK